MISLISKDILLQLKSMVIWGIIEGFLGTGADSTHPIIFSVFLNIFLLFSLIEQTSKEKRNNFLIILISCPVGKKTLVLSKYISSICIFFSYVAISSILNLFRINEYPSIFVSPKLILSNLLVFLIIRCIFYSLYFISNNVASILSNFLLILVFILFSIFITFIRSSINYLVNLSLINFLIASIIVFTLCVLSYLISLSIFKNREFV